MSSSITSSRPIINFWKDFSKMIAYFSGKGAAKNFDNENNFQIFGINIGIFLLGELRYGKGVFACFPCRQHCLLGFSLSHSSECVAVTHFCLHKMTHLSQPIKTLECGFFGGGVCPPNIQAFWLVNCKPVGWWQVINYSCKRNLALQI